jgi:hypothetical protein
MRKIDANRRDRNKGVSVASRSILTEPKSDVIIFHYFIHNSPLYCKSRVLNVLWILVMGKIVAIYLYVQNFPSHLWLKVSINQTWFSWWLLALTYALNSVDACLHHISQAHKHSHSPWTVSIMSSCNSINAFVCLFHFFLLLIGVGRRAFKLLHD